MQETFVRPLNTVIQDTCVTSEKNRKGQSFRKQVRYLYSYVVPHRRILMLSLVLSLVSTGLGLVQPYFAKIIIDRIFLGDRPDLLLPVLSALIVLLVFSFVIRVGNNYIYTRYSASILFSMRQDLFQHLQRVPLTYFSKKKLGDVYSRIATDMADIQALVTDIFPRYLFDTLTLLITGIILVKLNWKMALLSMAVLPPALLLVRCLKPKLLALSNDLAETNADMSHFLFESLSNTAVIRAFGAEKAESEKLDRQQSKVLGFLLRFQVLGAVSGSIPVLFGIVNTLIVFGFGGWQVLHGQLTIGTLVAFSVYQGRVFSPLQGLLDGVLSFQKSKVAILRVREILDIRPYADETGAIGDTILTPEEMARDIEVNRLSFSYDGDSRVLDDISFTIPQGKVTAVMGESGAGKTTLCHILLRLFNPGTGGVFWAGHDIRTLEPAWFRKQVAMVSQQCFLFHASILENIRFFKPDADMDDVRSAAASARLDTFIQSLPQGYHTLIGDRGTRLSGGQKQRLAIARAILQNPQVLIMDEATAFLDNRVENEIKSALEKLMEGRTILMVSHRKTAVQNAHKMIVLGRNTVEYQGPVKDWLHEF